MKITAVGDCAVLRNLPLYDGFKPVRDFIMQGDVRFCNLETTVCENCFAARHSGGTWLKTTPDVLRDFLAFGFCALTVANNHCMDYAYDGFMQTVQNVRAAGLAPIGGGKHLAEASAPVYIDTPSGRAAIIACTTTFSPGAEAGEQSRDLPGRPGINAIHLQKTVYVSQDDFAALSRIGTETALFARENILRAEGYLPPENADSLTLGGLRFKVGTPHVAYELDETDMARIMQSVRDASFQADVVLLSVHSHEIDGTSKEKVPAFLSTFAHRCIDAGVHAVIGHGPHLLRPVEIYKGLPVFYSLGDFILQLENCRELPDAYYRQFDLTPEAGIYEVFRRRTRDFTVGLQRQPEMLESVVPFFEITNGKLQNLSFLPVELGFGMRHSQIGWPRRKTDGGILERLSAMSRGLSIHADGSTDIA